jgi:hypothetical protein
MGNDSPAPYFFKRRKIKMSLKQQRIEPGQPGYFEKNENRYRYCNEFHQEGFRCTRKQGHRPPHAAHTVMGVEGSTENVFNDKGELIEVRVKEGAKNTMNVQIATW